MGEELAGLLLEQVSPDVIQCEPAEPRLIDALEGPEAALQFLELADDGVLQVLDQPVHQPGVLVVAGLDVNRCPCIIGSPVAKYQG